MLTSTSNGDTEWHTDPENPMLGPNGELHDASDQLDQFVSSPEVPHCLTVPQDDDLENDLP